MAQANDGGGISGGPDAAPSAGELCQNMFRPRKGFRGKTFLPRRKAKLAFRQLRSGWPELFASDFGRHTPIIAYSSTDTAKLHTAHFLHADL